MNKRLLLAGLFVPIAVMGVLAFIVVRNSMRPVVRPELDTDSSSTASTGADSAADLQSWEPGALGWNRFRGSNGKGTIEDALLPNAWSEDTNLRWSTALTGDGSSSPVLSERQVFLTSYEYEREGTGNVSAVTRYVSSYDRETGERLWEQAIEGVLPEDPYIGNGLPEHGYATNTPVVDQEHVYAFLGKSGVYCFTLAGEQVWHRSVGTGSNPKGWGSCASLILYGDYIIVNAAEESEAILALDRRTGEVIWKAESPDLHYAFGTPALVKAPNGSWELVVGLPKEVWGLNPDSGKLLWYASTPIGGNQSPCVIVEDNLAYIYGGFRNVGSVCVAPGGRGDVSETHVKWTSKLTSYISSPVIIDGRALWIDDRGRCWSQDVLTGEELSRGRLPVRISGRVTYASMLSLNGDLLIQTRYDGNLVLTSDGSFELLHHNQLDDESMSNATPAAGGGQLFLRTDDNLHCIQASSS